jgi:2-polyprenyl-6-methoxyphenol hydroxylase-like FAD-dependent oxidoreductase
MSKDAPMVETDVLVVGSGPAGAAAALFLATYGTRTLVVTKYGSLSDTPRAHITNQRTMETLRDAGLEDQLMSAGTPWELMGNTTFCTSLAGEELGRVSSWGTDVGRHADYRQQSPCTMLDAPQTITEPILMQAAQARGAKVRFDTEYLSHTQDENGVVTLVRDRLTGAEYPVHSKYLVGADGARSAVAADLGLPFEGPGAVAGAPPSRTRTTWPGSCTTWSRAWPIRRCSTPTTPKEPQWPGRSSSGRTRASPTPAGSSPPWTLTTPPTWPSSTGSWRCARLPARRARRSGNGCARRSPTSPTSSTRTGSSTTIVTPRRRYCRTGTPMPEFTRDPELCAQATTWPGAKLPHAWVTRAGVRRSTLDLGGHGGFSLWTGIGGQAWLDAAASLTADTGLPITLISIGPGQTIEDPYGSWAELSELADGGVLLVRPDLYIAARHRADPSSPEAAGLWLRSSLESVLGRR